MELKTAMIFGGNMVLQQGKPVPVWGTAQPGKTVSVCIQGKEASGIADECGNWKALLPELEVSLKETLVVAAGEEQLAYENIAVGEVWLAAGQSNMEFYMRYDADLAEAKRSCWNPNIRFFDYPEVAYEGQWEEYDYSLFGYWRSCDAENLEYYSAAAYYFACDLQKDLDVPIGIVGCNWGGTRADCWMPEERIKKAGGAAWIEDYKAVVKELDLAAYEKAYKENPMNDPSHPFEVPFVERMMYGMSREEQLDAMKYDAFGPMLGPLHQWRPAGLFHTMLKKVVPFAIRGILYYQGESDEKRAELYEGILRELICCWREEWNEELPFIMVQLAPFEEWMAETGERYPEIRRAQEKVAHTTEKVWLTSIGDVGMRYDIHPKKKKPVGERMALLALGHVYGRNISCEAPEFLNAVWKGRNLELNFKYVDEWKQDGADIQAFAIRRGNTEINKCDYQISLRGNKVIIEFKEDFDGDDISVQFAQTGYYKVNLYNEVGIPLKPFKADEERGGQL